MLRPFAIAGASLLGAGLVAGGAPSVGYVPSLATVRDVNLTAGESDLLAPWIEQFNTASANATALVNAFFEAPGVGWQQMIANQSGYLQDFFNDPSSSTVATISQQMQDNLAGVLTGYALQNATTETTNAVTQYTLDSGGITHQIIWGQIGGYLPPSVNPAEIQPIIDFLASPASGIIMGDLGPFIAPWVALGNSISAGDDWNGTLANMVGAYFNGADLSLNSLIPAIEQSGQLPAGMNIENLDIAFGGLLSPGLVGDVADPGVGGSIFNSLGIYMTGVPTLGEFDLTGRAVGPLGALEGWAQAIGSVLGWDGSGSPLSDVTLPIIPTDFSSLLQDVASGLGL